MKKRIKGLIALWIALVMAAASLATVWAASEDTVYIYYGKEQLIDGKQFVDNASDAEQGLYHLSDFKAGDLLNESLLDNIPGGYVIPEGYKLDGWNVWTYTSGAKVYYSETKGLGETIPSSDFIGPDESNTSSGKYYDSNSAKRLILEPVLKLTYEIEHQPTDEQPYVTTNTDIDKISNYEWYAVNTVEYDVVDQISNENQQIKGSINSSNYYGYGKYNESTGKWESESESDSTDYGLYMKLPLNEGDIIKIIPDPDVAGTEFDYLHSETISTDGELFTKNENGEWLSIKIPTTNAQHDLRIRSGKEFSVQIKVIRDIISENAVEGQNTYKLTGSQGTYFCKVTFTNGASLISNRFTYKGYGISCNEPSNGSYKVLVGGVEAEKTNSGNTVTIETIPEEGYELDGINVTKTDDGSIVEMVTANSFLMPSCPVTIDVTFKKKTYAVTLPEATVGYTVESSQTSPVEHGSNFSFTVTLNDDYTASGSFEVKANTTALTATESSEKVYTYIINNVTEAQEITVSGVMKEHNITKSSTANGEYTVKAGENEADKAVAGTTVTVTATPVTGYELDAIKVTSTNDGGTNVTVTDNSFTMPDYPVTIDVTFRKKTYTVTLPEATVGYTVESSQTSPVEYGSDYSFTVILGEGYAAASDFVVKENTSVLTAISSSENTYVYTIKNVTENKIVTVSGVADGTAPTIKITLDENNWWQTFLNKITFNLFFKNSRSLTIEAFDGESGIDSVWYYLTDTDLFPEDKSYTAKEIEDVITQWNEYKDNTGSISLPKDGRYVMYVKAVDKEGKVSFASTTGIVVDTTAPVIAGIEDGSTYYGDITFTISDEYLDSILVDQKPVDVKKDTESVTITADNDTHTVQVTDKVGNSITYTIDVYAKWVSEGISSVGKYELKPGIPYKLDSGKWKVVGDNTVYEGGSTFYVHESGTYEFQKQ